MTATEALQQTRGLNLGSGPHYAEGWINVDLHHPGDDHRGPDVYANALDLADTFPPDTFTACYMGHFLEHVEWHAIPHVLAQVRHVCKPGAIIMVVGPCIYRAIATHQPEHLITAILADPRTEHDGHGHAWTPTEELTRVALELGGLDNVTTVPIGSVAKPQWPNPTRAPWQTAAMGTVP